MSNSATEAFTRCSIERQRGNLRLAEIAERVLARQAECCRTATPSTDFALLPCLMPGKLSDEQIEAYLDDHPSWAILSSIDQDGFPHTVPLGYFRVGHDIIMGIRDGTRKVANVESNPNVSVMLEDGSTMDDIRGVLFQGHARIVREPRETLQLATEAARARGVPETEWPTAPRPGVTYIRMTPIRTVSWDYATSTPEGA